MTEETNTDAPAAEAAAPAAETTAPADTSADEAALQEQIEKQREDALADKSEPTPTPSTDETEKSADPSVNDTADSGAGDPPPALNLVVVVPAIEAGNKVWVRNSKDGQFDTCGIVTRYDLETGVANITIFPDGETPRPLSSVPFVENQPQADFAWNVH